MHALHGNTSLAHLPVKILAHIAEVRPSATDAPQTYDILLKNSKQRMDKIMSEAASSRAAFAKFAAWATVRGGP